MAFSINTNISAMTANLHSTLNSMNTDRSLGALASGSALNSAAYDASGLGIANQLSAQVSGLGQAIMNSNDSIGMIQVADGAMQEYGNILEDVKVLTLQASNGTLNDSNRAVIQKQIDALLESADDIAKTTQYNGIKLLDGSGGESADGTFVTQAGADAGDTQSVRIGDAQTSSLLSGTIDVTTQAAATSSLDTLDSALDDVNTLRANLGASQNQLMSNIKNISVTQVNIASAESQIRDIDFAAESANFSQANIRAQIGSFAQAQANASATSVANLFR
jgi:flagellin